VPTDPNAGIPDLVKSLASDSKRLLRDEADLAKIELHESVHQGGRAAMWLVVSFGVAVIAIVAFTLFVATLIGRVVDGHMWLGAIVAAVIDLAIGRILLTRSKAAFAEPAAAVSETRAAA
jgi:uncharacterized membrane protein YqjE